ncbi:CHY zinc finger protein [Alkalihalobacillus sp. LMS6]|uniref:CHY zinc finger protein n=1 Tax=Alkalihalobacillus sp. LMS6 TaxID=2924034 RepID=UPI0020D06985|nr:CHY zinc finger protein [Alkalihalobacillus sp. LMS6]UTR06382.1 CHY zinc finger protein [Alkalihalobacillus sp. LMS6]
MTIIKGKVVDQQTRCVHYQTQFDIVAIKFACCGDFYPCYKCHDEAVDHKRKQWKQTEFTQRAILCGACHGQITIHEYVQASCCPLCQAQFNTNCSLHHHLYFEGITSDSDS